MFPSLVLQKFYGTEGKDVARRIIVGPDSTVIIAGSVPDGNGLTDGYIVCLSRKGEQLWEKRLGGKGREEIRDVVVSNNGTEIFYCGVTGSNLKHPENGADEFYADYWVGKLGKRGDLLWQKSFGGSAQDQAFALAPTEYNGCLVVGSSWSRDFDVTGAGNTDKINTAWTLVLNQFGQVMRSVCFGGSKNDWAQSICKTSDGGYIIAASTNSPELDNSKSRHNGDAWFIKLDFSGNLLWQRIVKRPYEDMVMRVTENRYGMIMAVGSSFVSEGNGKEFWLLKLDKSGTPVVNKTFGGPGYEELTSIALCHDDGFIMSGYSSYNALANPQIKGRRDFWLIRTNVEGDIIWQKTFGGPNNEEGWDVCEYAPGVFYALGVKENTFEPERPKQGQDLWVLRVSETPCENAKPKFYADMTEYRERVGRPIRFVNQSTIGDKWKWDFGDGTTSSERNPVKVYKKEGIFIVKLSTVISEQCTPTFVAPKPVVIYQP